MTYEIDDLVTIKGERLFKVIRRLPNQYTRYEVMDVTPNGPRDWKQKKGGGVYVLQFLNDDKGQTSIAHRDDMEAWIPGSKLCVKYANGSIYQEWIQFKVNVNVEL